MKHTWSLFFFVTFFPTILFSAASSSSSSSSGVAERYTVPTEVVIKVIKNGRRSKSWVKKDGCNNDISGFLEGCWSEETHDYSIPAKIKRLKPPSKDIPTGDELRVLWRVPSGRLEQDEDGIFEFTNSMIDESWLRSNYGFYMVHHDDNHLYLSVRKGDTFRMVNKSLAKLPRGVARVLYLLEFNTKGDVKATRESDDRLVSVIGAGASRLVPLAHSEQHLLSPVPVHARAAAFTSPSLAIGGYGGSAVAGTPAVTMYIPPGTRPGYQLPEAGACSSSSWSPASTVASPPPPFTPAAMAAMAASSVGRSPQ